MTRNEKPWNKRRSALRAYGRSLSGDRRALLEQFHYVDMARKVVGVGSVGTRALVVLFLGIDGEDRWCCRLQEARESVLAPYAGKSRFANQGQRVVEGQRLMQRPSSIFLGWSRGPAVDGTARDFYVRQCGTGSSRPTWSGRPWTLWSAWGSCAAGRWPGTRTVGRPRGDRCVSRRRSSADRALSEFAETYADRNDRDFELFEAAAKAGRIDAERGIWSSRSR